jgi:hypothetical protein
VYAYWVVRRRGSHIIYTVGLQVAVRLSAFYPPWRFLILISVRDWVDPKAIVRLKGLGQLTGWNHIDFESGLVENVSRNTVGSCDMGKSDLSECNVCIRKPSIGKVNCTHSHSNFLFILNASKMSRNPITTHNYLIRLNCCWFSWFPVVLKHQEGNLKWQ